MLIPATTPLIIRLASPLPTPCPAALLTIPQSLAPVVDKDTAKKDLLPVILHLAKDPVPNVRFNAARAVEGLIPKLDKRCAAGGPALPPLTPLSPLPVRLLLWVFLLRPPVLTGLTRPPWRSSIKDDVRPMLEALKGDPDADVMYYSTHALAAC